LNYAVCLLWSFGREAPINAFDKFGFSPLMQAAQRGYVEYVHQYMLYRADTFILIVKMLRRPFIFSALYMLKPNH